jgi:FtsH-binding integral membrane protein
MYIVAIAWMYVVMMVSFLQPTIFRGLVTFFGAGLLPLGLLLFLIGTPQRRRNKQHQTEQAALTKVASDPTKPELPDAPPEKDFER